MGESSLPLILSLAPLFSVAKNTVNTVPSAKLLGLGHPVSPLAHHVYLLFTSCTLPLPAGVFFSHIKPVWWSVTVPSPLSVNRWACATPAHSNVAHTAATVRLVFRMVLPFFWAPICTMTRGCRRS